MKTNLCLLLILFLMGKPVFTQNTNCFLEDFTPKNATIPISVIANKTTNAPTVTVTLTADTLGKISKYVFGNALAVWMGNNTGSQHLLKMFRH
jgi:hypothetical protein